MRRPTISRTARSLPRKWFVVNDSRPWWLWPNVLSLDAPAVAVTWQVFLASVAGVAVPLAASAVLALVVWAVYLADRGLDARRGANTSDRHRAAGRNPIAWAAAASAAALSAVLVALTVLPRAYLEAGGIVAFATIGYLAAVHFVRAKNVLDRGAKELSVGVVFAAGVTIPLVATAEPFADWLPGAVAFAGLCWLNCTLISRWEDGREQGPPLWVAVLAGSVAAAAALGAPVPVRLAVFGSTAALAALHASHAVLSVRAARVLADVVLLSPLAVAVCS
jgi:hypothetical protein